MNEAIGRKSGIPNPKSEASGFGTSDLPKRSPVQEFESLWRKEQTPNVRDFLQQAADLSPQQVVEVLCIDQWQRWHHGDRIPAETYLEMHPALASAPDAAFDLVFGEFLLREQAGEEPALETFSKRFPQFAGLLERQAKLHQAFEAESLSPATGPNAAATQQAGPNAKDPSEWPQVPGYTIVAKLGQGGMGQVFKAKQERLDRVVALKIIRQESLSQDPHAIQRFTQEARAAAKLSHPNIIVIYDFNRIGNTYFIAMEYVEGVDLHQLVRDCGPLPIPLACHFVRQVALGLQHGHQHGIVHRDIKPSNLLLSLPSVDVGVSGFKTLPFRLHRKPVTPPDSAMGSSLTLSMPLEHLKDAVVKIMDMGMALLAHRPGDPDSPRWTHQGTLMGTPDFLAPEQAMDARQVDIRADLYSLGCTLYFLVAGRPPFGEFPLMKKLMMHQIAKPRPIRELQPNVSSQIEQIINKLMAKLPEGRFQTPLELADALAALEPLDSLSIPLRKSAPGIQPTLTTEPERAPAASLPTEKSRPAQPEEARYKWTGREGADQVAATKEAKAVVLLKGHSAWVTAIAFSSDRHTLASGAVHGSVRLWDLSGSKPCEKAILKTDPGEIHSLAFGPGNRILATGCGSLEGFVWLWDLAGLSPKKLATLQGHKSPVEALTFSPDNHWLASGGCDKTAILWEMAGSESKELAAFKGHTENVKALAFSPDSKTLVSASLDGTIRFWRRGSIWSKDLLAMLQGDWGPVYTIAFSPDGRYLAFGSLDQTIRLFSLSGPQFREKTVLRGHLGVVRQIQFNPDNTLVSVCDGGRVISWNIATGAKAHELQLPKAKVCSVAFTVDGRYLAAGTSDGVVNIFRIYERKGDG